MGMSFSSIEHIMLSHVMHVTGSGSRRGGTHIRTRHSYWLDVEWGDGNYSKWDFLKKFGDPVVIGNTIVAAWRAYRRNKGLPIPTS